MFVFAGNFLFNLLKIRIMKGYFLLIALFCSVQIWAQSDLQGFEIYERNVSRIDQMELGGEMLKLERKSQDAKLKNGDICLTKSDKKGNTLWQKFYGGTGYEYIGSFIKTADQGFLILGTTSSFGKGNNDVYLVKTDNKGNEMWSKTYGGFFNEYGKYLKAKDDGTFIIKGKKQFCDSENVGGNCYDKTWIIKIDENGEMLSEKLLDMKSI